MEPDNGWPSSTASNPDDPFTTFPASTHSHSGLPSTYGDFFSRLQSTPRHLGGQIQPQDNQRAFGRLLHINITPTAFGTTTHVPPSPNASHNRENTIPPWGLADLATPLATMNLCGPMPGSDSPELCRSSLPTKRKVPIGTSQPKRRKTIDSLPRPGPVQAKRPLSKQEKLDQFFDLLDELKWSLGELLHHLFVWRYSPSEVIPFSCRHGTYIQRYLGGHTLYNVSGILDAWFTSPYGRERESGCDSQMFSTEKHYSEILAARPAMSSFAAQIVQDQLISEARQAVKPSTGLYAPLRRDSRTKNLHWNDLSTSLTATAIAEFKKYQPLTFHYMVCIAQGTPRKRSGVVAVRCHRPVNLVVAHALAALDFCRSSNTRLVPISRGILYLASTVPSDVIAYNSHIGNMPSINTLKVALKVFSDEKAEMIRSLSRDAATQKDQKTGEEFIYVNHLLFDNVQHYLKQRDQRIGRENSMVIGIAATYIRLKASPLACDPAERQRVLDLNKREGLTVDQLIGLIDQSHLRKIGVLQWLGALTKYIPELAHMQSDISLRYRTRCRRLAIPAEETQMHPLACSGKNEAVISELKDAFVDFLDQLDQRSDDHDDRLWLAGRDGMSFNNLHILKRHLQADPNPFQSFESMVPVLQPWHTMWTDLNRIYTTHWGELLDDNPSTLAYSAKKIGRPPPGNLKKVDYYPSAELLDLVHDMRMLDCWRTYLKTNDLFKYFTDLYAKGTLPSFEDLEVSANKLFSAYSTSAAYHQCASDARSGQSPWSIAIPEGDKWISTPTEPSSLPPQPPRPSHKKNKRPEPSKDGDITLSESIAFMRDAMIAREAVYAVAEGDVGRLWEALKAMVFTFAGSSHRKYTGYLLEMICTLELESGKELRELILRSMIVNLSGKPGHWQAGDIIQELLNRCLEPIIQRNDIQFGSDYIRNHWARNILDVYKLKRELRDAVGLARHTGKHTKPHEKPEVKILLKEYANLELHCRRPGRIYGKPRDVDDMTKGIETLSNGGLARWVKKTTEL
ncbi:hypothetical protein CCMSSC00406_0003676 [Pleurotus cornucopiae]|uniref:Uncharacterized protein n=1 Tax=Pleurotus cornucopiae TaxID=5321 RepID=A0ACB7IIY0_PLECO|nr:hypothetical protein CCMSSC00406_0003676 [Pleurotus cornucopiae]